MSVSASARVQSREEMHRLVRSAVMRRRPIAADYDGTWRLLCPHVLGRNQAGQHRVFCYQYGGESQRGPQPKGGEGIWRCLALEKFSSVELLDAPWQTAPHALQRCVENIEWDTDDHRGGDPQHGQ